MASTRDYDRETVSIEGAIDEAGFGLYSYIMVCMVGVTIISFAAIGYGSSILVPVSACELNTTVGQQGMLAAAPVIGSILGSTVWGYLADTRGRRSMLLVALLGGAGINAIASISVNWIMLMLLQFTAALFTAGLYSMSMSLMSESVPMSKRNLVVILVTSIFLLAQGVMAVLAIPIIPLGFSYYIPALDIYWNSWRTLVVIYSIPAIVTAIWLYFMQESPKFVYTKGNEQRTLEILRAIHKVNNLSSAREFPVKSIQREHVEKKEGSSSFKDQIFLLFKQPLLKYTILMTLLLVFQQVGAFGVWLPTIANQFVRIIETGESMDLNLCGVIGVSMNAPVDPDATPCALNVTSLLIVLVVGVMHSSVNALLTLVVNRVGRRNMVMIVTSVCGGAGILVNLIPNAIGSAVMFAILLLGIIVFGLYTAIIVALFPTNLRAMAIALPITGGRIINFASIQILNLMLANSCDAGFYLFSSIFASSAIVAYFLPDDRRLMQRAVAPPSKDEDQSSSQQQRNLTEL